MRWSSSPARCCKELGKGKRNIFRHGGWDGSVHVLHAPGGRPRHAGVAEGRPQLPVRDNSRTEVSVANSCFDLHIF